MENRYFQYLAGPRCGEVLIYDHVEEEDDMVFVCFKDGSRCNEELILPLNERVPGSMLMAEVDSHTNVWKISEEWVGRQEERWELNEAQERVCVQPYVEGRRKIIATPPRRTSAAKFGQIAKRIETPVVEEKKTPELMNDPVWVMMDKARKFDTEVPMSLTISLPSKALYDVAKESFEDGGPKVVEYIISNLDDTDLKFSLKRALLEAYEDTTETLVEPITRDREPPGDIVEPGAPIMYEPDVVEEQIVGNPQPGLKLKDGEVLTENEQHENG